MVQKLSSEIANSQLGQGVTNMVADLTTWLMLLGPAVAGAACVYFFIRRGMADEQEGKLWNKRIWTAVICGVACCLVGGIIKLLSSYFN